MTINNQKSVPAEVSLRSVLLILYGIMSVVALASWPIIHTEAAFAVFVLIAAAATATLTMTSAWKSRLGAVLLVGSGAIAVLALPDSALHGSAFATPAAFVLFLVGSVLTTIDMAGSGVSRGHVQSVSKSFVARLVTNPAWWFTAFVGVLVILSFVFVSIGLGVPLGDSAAACVKA
jgi:hypothetical protein